MKARAAMAAAGLVLAALSCPASGCGFCIEDKVAAVYDHAAIGRALERHHHVAFFAVDGPMPAAAQSRRAVRKALASSKGVDAASVRVCVESASLALSYDPKRIAPQGITDALNRELASGSLAVSLLKVMERFPELKAGS